MGEVPVGASSIETPPDDRLDSWKEIAAYLKRDVTTVQRWEKREGMPVHRHLHDRIGSVYAYRAELDLWTRTRNPTPLEGKNGNSPSTTATSGAETERREPEVLGRRRQLTWLATLVVVSTLAQG